MATVSTSCLWLVVLCVWMGPVISSESSDITQSDLVAGSPAHHQAQKRSAAALLEQVDSAYPDVDMDQTYPDASSFLGGDPYDDELLNTNNNNKRTLFRFGKRGSIFRFGKRARGSLFRFGKRGGSLFRFGKRGGSLFRFGKRSDDQDWNENGAASDKRASLFRFGKRAHDSDNVLDALESYYGYPSYALSDDVDSKRNVNSFHWGESEK